jgi:heme-degrading monooxygenase HmoA
MSVVVINAVTVPEERRAEFEARFASRSGNVAGAPGFEAFELMRPVSGDRYLVYTRWRSMDDFDAWHSSADFAAGHRQHSGHGPVSQQSEVWTLEVLEAEYAELVGDRRDA